MDAARGGWVLETSRPLRLFTLFILYVGQGMPLGLTWFAIPAWLAVSGASAADIGTFASLSSLPWSLKLVNGFIMDRYTFLPMGRRRVWILGAQGAMIIALLIGAGIGPSAADIRGLSALGFTANVATAFQDVAVDGLAVDIMAEDERARGSGMMFGGQSIGMAAATAICGFLIEDFGASAAFFAVALSIICLCLYVACIYERVGERRMPWSDGKAHARNLSIQLDAWWPILKSTFVSLTKSKSLAWLVARFSVGIFYGAMTGATPLIGAKYVGWEVSEISAQTAAASLVSGLLCMTLGGWLGDRYGAKRIGILWVSATITLMAAMYVLEPHWTNPALFLILLYSWSALNSLCTVALLPISMRLCNPKVAATQFTIYMATGNFGISFGAFLLGLTDRMGGLVSIFLVVIAGQAVVLFMLLLVKFPRRPAYYAKEAEAALVFEAAPPPR